jgi:hypothetical protein
MSFFDDTTKAEVVARLARLRDPVRIIYFTQPHACESRREQQSLLEELAPLSHKLSLEIKDFVAGDAEAKRCGIGNVPTTVVAGERGAITFDGYVDGARNVPVHTSYKRKFYGATGGRRKQGRRLAMHGDPHDATLHHPSPQASGQPTSNQRSASCK